MIFFWQTSKKKISSKTASNWLKTIFKQILNDFEKKIFYIWDARGLKVWQNLKLRSTCFITKLQVEEATTTLKFIRIEKDLLNRNKIDVTRGFEPVNIYFNFY